ncbi:hypothetical protein V5799_000329 [Amblyomma americanum]|uniref:Uncharacterized protein n=1 Tax=Amblyomma americanum TaxID=6943 RepID=A0AAQ4D3C5_AMBAM
MDPELQTLVKLPVVLVSRKELYSIITVLGLTVLGCACVLGYSFAHCGELDHGVEKLRIYITSGDKMAERRPADAGGAVGNRSTTVKEPATWRVPRVEPAVNTGNVSVDLTGDAGASRQEATGGRRPDMAQSEDKVGSAAGPTGKNGPPIAYSVVAPNVTQAVPVGGFIKTR